MSVGRSEFTANRTKGFINIIKTKQIFDTYNLVLIDVTSPFTVVPLAYKINLLSKRICNRKERHNKISRDEIKGLLLLCTKNVNFTFQNNVYQQKDGVAMVSPLGPILVGIFIVELERDLIPKLSKYLKTWTRNVYDKITSIKPGCVSKVINTLNNFIENIKFTMNWEVMNEYLF